MDLGPVGLNQPHDPDAGVGNCAVLCEALVGGDQQPHFPDGDAPQVRVGQSLVGVPRMS